MITRIRELLELRQLSPTQFADLIGVGRPVISHILSERNKPSLEVVQKIISAFPDIELAWLLNGTGPMLASAASAVPPASVGPPVASPAGPTPPPVAEALAAPPVVAAPLPTVRPAPLYATLPDTGANAAVSASRPLPPKFRPTKSTAAPVAITTPLTPAASVIPTDAAPLPSYSPPAAIMASSLPSPFASVETMPAPVAASSVVVPAAGPLPVAASPVSPILSQVAPAAGGYDLPTLAQQVPVAPQPVSPSTASSSYAPMTPPAPSLPLAATWADSAPEVAVPNPAAALSFLGEPGKAIRRIVIFYRDGSFSDYVPEGQ